MNSLSKYYSNSNFFRSSNCRSWAGSALCGFLCMTAGTAFAENDHFHSETNEPHVKSIDHHEDPLSESLEHRTHDHDQSHEDEDLVQISAEVMEEFGIKLAVASGGVLQEKISLPGEIGFNREAVAHATPKFNGTVLSIDARLADQVHAGQILATMENADNLRPFEIKAPFDGVVVTYNITLGETIEAGTPVFTIANLSTVWADMQIYQKDMAHVKKGSKVVIMGAHDSPNFEGTVAYIAPTIEEHTRTGLGRIVVENSNGSWKPGQFVTGVFTIEEHAAALRIPRSSVLEFEGKTVVFVQTDEGFVPRPITLGHSDATHFEVVSGIRVGETIVIENAISLKAELGKSSFGGHEGHVH